MDIIRQSRVGGEGFIEQATSAAIEGGKSDFFRVGMVCVLSTDFSLSLYAFVSLCLSISPCPLRASEISEVQIIRRNFLYLKPQ